MDASFHPLLVLDLTQLHPQMLPGRNHKIILPFHALLGRLVWSHVELLKHVREVEIQFRISEIDPDAGSRASREGNQSVLELSCSRTEPAFRLEAFGVREVCWVHVVAVSHARDGSLLKVSLSSVSTTKPDLLCRGSAVRRGRLRLLARLVPFSEVVSLDNSKGAYAARLTFQEPPCSVSSSP